MFVPWNGLRMKLFTSDRRHAPTEVEVQPLIPVEIGPSVAEAKCVPAVVKVPCFDRHFLTDEQERGSGNLSVLPKFSERPE